MTIKKLKAFIICLLIVTSVSAQQIDNLSVDVRNMKKREILRLSYDELSELALEDLMYISDKFGISIDQLLQEAVSVSSKTELTTRESPGIISIITADEIKKSGALDLGQLLRTIPGIYFGYDVDGIIGIFMRGNWGHEGKVLFLIDDMELNESMYSVTPLLNYIAADQISSIEIIRGPGSALYGGYAELGVIRVITKTGFDINGVNTSATASAFSDATSGTSAHIAIGKNTGNSDFSIQANYNKQMMASGEFTDFYDDSYDMSNGWSNSELLQLNAKYSYKKFETNVFFNNYYIIPTGYDDLYKNKFRNIISRVRYTFTPIENLTITPSVSFKTQRPYNFKTESWFYKRDANQLNNAVDISYSPTNKLHILTGIGYKIDYAEISKQEEEIIGEYFYNNKNSINHNTLFIYSQIGYYSSFGNFFAGVRFEDHSVSGNNIAPRLGYTKIFNNLNVKYLYSQAFRSPSIENINTFENIKPEKTFVNEFELGYKISSNIYSNITLFDIIIKDPIVYTFDYENETEQYLNDKQSGTTGLELELRTIYEKWNASVSYSFYDASKNNKTEYYKVIFNDEEKSHLLKGAPMHTIHLKTSAQILSNLYLSPSLSWYSKQFGYVDSPLQQNSLNSYILADVSLLAQNILTKNLDLSLSCFNLLNQKHAYIQPFALEDMAEKPYPGAPMSIRLKAMYRF